MVFRWLVGATLYWWAARVNPSNPVLVLCNWLLGPDSIHYHNVALNISSFLAGKTDAVYTAMAPSHLGAPLIFGGLYSLFGNHFLVGVLFNCLFYAVAVLFAYRLAFLLNQSTRSARWLALIVAFWPPSFAYTVILLREPIWLMAIFAALCCLAEMLRSRPVSWPRFLLAELGLLAGCYLHVVMRYKLGVVQVLILLPPALLALFWRGGPGFKKVRLRGLASYLVVVAGVGLGIVFPFTSLITNVVKNPQARPVHKSRVAIHRMVPTGPPPLAMKPYVKPQRAVDKKQKPAATTTTPKKKKSLLDQTRKILLKLFFGEKNLFITLYGWRLGYAAHGNSVAPSAKRPLKNVWDYTRAIIIGLGNTFLFPTPWDYFSINTDYGMPSILISGAVSIQSLFWYVLLIGIVLGMFRKARRQPLVFSVVICWAMLIGMVIGFVLVNLGALYRVRDGVLLPLIMLLDPAPYAWGWARLKGAMGRIGFGHRPGS